jgi:hypothetical protein
MEGPAVVRRDDCDSPEPELARGPEHPQRDLPAVRDENLLHRSTLEGLLPTRRRGGR